MTEEKTHTPSELDSKLCFSSGTGPSPNIKRALEASWRESERWEGGSDRPSSWLAWKVEGITGSPGLVWSALLVIPHDA